MARKRRKKFKQSERIADNGLIEPYPAGPVPCPKYVLYCRRPYNAVPGEGRTFVWTFNAIYAAKKFVDAIIGDGKHRWLRADQILTAADILIETRDAVRDGGRRNSELENIMEHEYTPLEAAWQIGIPDSTYLANFLRPFETAPTLRPAVTERKARTSPPRAPRDGLTTIGMICSRLGIDPRDGRATLRRAKITQPDAGWAFTADQVPRIEAVLRKSMGQ